MKRETLLIVGLVLLALFVRGIYLVELSSSPTFHAPLIDSQNYDRMARELAAGEGLSDGFFWQPFFYPIFLAAIYVLTDDSHVWARCIQLLLGCGTCLLTYRLGRRLVSPGAGLVAGGIVALYGPLIFFDAELMATGWASFWSAALPLLSIRALDTRRPGSCFALGICCALAVLTRPTFLPFVLAAAVGVGVTLVRSAVGRMTTALAAVALLLGFLLPTVPVAELSGRVTGRTSFLPAGGGINFYIGNHPDMDSLVAIRPGWRWLQLTQSPRGHGILLKKDTSAFFRGRAWESIRASPAGFVHRLMKKGVQLISSREIPRNVDVYLYRDDSSILSALVWKVGGFGFPFGLLLPLALVGAVEHRGRWPAWSFVLLYAASILMVFVTARYRIPLVAPLAVSAAAGCLALRDMMLRKRWRRLGYWAAGLAALVALMSLPGPFAQESTDYRAEMHYLLGRRASDSGDATEAERLFETALRRQPRHADALTDLGTLLARQGQTAAAVARFRAALEIEPEHGIALANLARVLARRGELDAAAEQMQRAIDVRPWEVDQRLDQAKILFRLDRPDEAVRQGRAAVELDPFEPAVVDLLTSFLIGAGRRDEAIAHVRGSLIRARAAGAGHLAGHLDAQLRRLDKGGQP